MEVPLLKYFQIGSYIGLGQVRLIWPKTLPAKDYRLKGVNWGQKVRIWAQKFDPPTHFRFTGEPGVEFHMYSKIPKVYIKLKLVK